MVLIFNLFLNFSTVARPFLEFFITLGIHFSNIDDIYSMGENKWPI
jgi:hypothetical protein